MRVAQWALLAMLLQTASLAQAEVEKIAQVCKSSICFHWWPRLGVPEGFHHDRDLSLDMNVNALVPDKQTAQSDGVMMYGFAGYKPRLNGIHTLEQFIESDFNSFRREDPKIRIEPIDDILTADGKPLRVFRMMPSRKGRWEVIAYLEEGEFYMDMVLTAKSQSQLQIYMPAYTQLLRSYREVLPQAKP